MTLDEFFEGHEGSRPLFDALYATVDSLAPVEVRVTRSQVAFVGSAPFAWAWIPDRYLRGEHAPLVLSVALDHEAVSARWKQVVEPSPGRFMHHLELYAKSDIDEQVRGWLREAAALPASGTQGEDAGHGDHQERT